MNLSTTLNRKKQGEGGSALLFFYRLIPLISILTLILSCGIPSPVFLAPPETISFTNPSFYHADRNNPDIFRGYEIFYLIYDSDTISYTTDDEWESFFNSTINSSIITNPNSTLMQYSYTSLNIPSHKIRRAYASSDPDGPDYIPVMIPVDPTTVSLSGGTTAQFRLYYNDSDLFLEENSSTPQTIIASLEFPTIYNTASVILKRRVFEAEDSVIKSLLSFDSPLASSTDDLPASYDSIAFFALTTGFSMSSGQVISTVTYIGSLPVI